MTKDEYDKICSIIDRHISAKWVSANYQYKCISMQGVLYIKNEIKELVKEVKKK